MTKEYRPTSVQKFSRCPMLWHLTEVQGWEPLARSWTPEALIGSCLHEGLRAWWGGDIEPLYWLTTYWERNWPKDQPGEAGAWAAVLRSWGRVEKFCHEEMAQAKPILVEATIGNDGGVTPDLITEEQGQIVVTDWKYHHYVEPRNIQYRLEGIDRNHQFLHYAWRVGQTLMRPVNMVRKVAIIGGPKTQVKPATFQVTQPMLDSWYNQTQAKWGHMAALEDGRANPYRREEGCTMYGDKYPCPMWDACWSCGGDEGKMGNFYTRRVE